jgi:glycerophosphoryl diester phosphodiesterase
LQLAGIRTIGAGVIGSVAICLTFVTTATAQPSDGVAQPPDETVGPSTATVQKVSHIALQPAFMNNGVTAHRGYSGKYPENTLRAFRAALEASADWIECDLFKTADGRIVITHDANTARVADKRLVVAESTYAQLSQLDVAHGFRTRHELTLEECPRDTMPRLEDLLKILKRQHRTRVSLQPKQDIVDEVVALVRELEAESWVGFNEGSLARVRRVKELAPQLPVFYDTNGIQTEQHIQQAQKYGFEAIVMHHAQVSAQDVRLIRAAGLEAGAWTVNDAAEMKRLLKLGVTRIYTDFPDRLLELKVALDPGTHR